MPAVEKRGIRAVVHHRIHGNAREIHGHVITSILVFIEQTGSWKWEKVFQRQLKDGRWAKENLGFELLWSQSFTGNSTVSQVRFMVGPILARPLLTRHHRAASETKRNGMPRSRHGYMSIYKLYVWVV
jgi:hypothetical protein